MGEWSSEGKTYDTMPPWWFRRALYAGLPFSFAVVAGVSLQLWTLAVFGILVLLLFLVAAFVWDRVHQV